MPRTEQQNQAIRDKRRAKILTNALKTFAVNGYDKTSVDDITKSVKCSHGLFYHYFDSKEDVYRAVVEEKVLVDGVLPYEIVTNAGWEEGLDVLLSFFESAVKEGGAGLYKAVLIIDAGKGKSLDDFAKKFAQDHQLAAILENQITSGQAEGKLKEGNPKQFAGAINDIIEANVKKALYERKGFLAEKGTILALLGKD